LTSAREVNVTVPTTLTGSITLSKSGAPVLTTSLGATRVTATYRGSGGSSIGGTFHVDIVAIRSVAAAWGMPEVSTAFGPIAGIGALRAEEVKRPPAGAQRTVLSPPARQGVSVLRVAELSNSLTRRLTFHVVLIQFTRCPAPDRVPAAKAPSNSRALGTRLIPQNCPLVLV
jgi:hypothetical protein